MIINNAEIEGLKHLNTTQIVGTRLKSLIKRAVKEKKFKSQADFFNSIGENGIDKDTYSKYLNGTNNMKLDRLKEICLKLDCSSDYLLGLTPFNRRFAGIGSTLYKMGYTIEWDEYEADYMTISKDGLQFRCTERDIEDKFVEVLSFVMFQAQK